MRRLEDEKVRNGKGRRLEVRRQKSVFRGQKSEVRDWEIKDGGWMIKPG